MNKIYYRCFFDCDRQDMFQTMHRMMEMGVPTYNVTDDRGGSGGWLLSVKEEDAANTSSGTPVVFNVDPSTGPCWMMRELN